MTRPNPAVRGMTLIELMIVVAILSILAALTTAKFADMTVKSHEAVTKGNLGALRGALSIYYANNEGLFPYPGGMRDAITTGGRYMADIPHSQVPKPGNHGIQLSVTDVSGAFTDMGDWAYGGSRTGAVNVNCTHADRNGRLWTTW